GRGGLEAGQARSIVTLVATSIPGMLREDVTLVDQNGTLLSQQDSLSDEAITATQFNMTRSLEDDYKRRIMSMLTTLVGPEAVRAQVTADLDFTVTEQTRESYDPASQVVRSEQINEQQRAASDVTNGGVPGALANTPPQAGGNANPLGDANEQTVDSSRSSTRNFEVDRTLSKTRAPTGTIRRLSVAVLIDEAALTRTEAVAADAGDEGADAGAAETVTIDIDEVTALVQRAVGFTAARGDTVEVISQPFLDLEAPMEDSGPPIWENPVLRELAKQGLGVILALAVAFGIVRPMLKSIVEAPPAPTATLLPDPGTGISGQLDGPGDSSNALTYDEKVAAARNITSHDPARVAQVVRRWIEADGE
ncbi:MAG: flagellar basal-body MS-ring/collar protein FliF, partial [Pseudomonadota bacterium]